MSASQLAPVARPARTAVAVVSHAAVVPINQEPFAALAEAGADVVVFAPRRLRTDVRGRIEFRALDPFPGRVVALPVILGGYRRALGGQRGIHLILYRGLAGAVAAARPDIVYAEEEPWSLAALQVARLSARLGVPFVVHANQNVAKRLPPPFEGIRRAVLSRAAGATVRNAAAAELLRSGGFAAPICPFPHAVDPARYRVSPPALGLEGPVFGFVGRLVPEKGVLEYLRAVAAVRQRISRGSALVVGDGPLSDEARALAERLGVPARFEGALAHDAVPRFYRAMDVAVVPSRTTSGWKEQFGRIVIEANAAGVPVVVTDSGELPATAAATGGGLVVREDDEAAMAEALMRLGTDPATRRRLGERGRLGVERRFTPGAASSRLARFLEELVADGRSGR